MTKATEMRTLKTNEIDTVTGGAMIGPFNGPVLMGDRVIDGCGTMILIDAIWASSGRAAKCWDRINGSGLGNGAVTVSVLGLLILV